MSSIGLLYQGATGAYSGVEKGKWLRRVLPCPLSPKWGHRTGTDASLDFFTVPTLLPLSTISQMEFSWSGFSLMFVLIPVKVKMSDIGQPLRMTLRLLS